MPPATAQNESTFAGGAEGLIVQTDQWVETEEPLDVVAEEGEELEEERKLAASPSEVGAIV